MPAKDSYNTTKIALLLEPQDLAHTDTYSAYVDLAGYESALFEVSVGALTGVDGSNYLTPTLLEATETPDSTASYSAVDSADIIGGFSKIDAAAEDSVVQVAGYIGSERYVCVLLDYASTGISAGVVGVNVILGHTSEIPPGAPTTGAVS